MNRSVPLLVALALMPSAALARNLPATPGPLAAAAPVIDWTGLYFGAHAGYGGGMSDWWQLGDFTSSGGLVGGQIGFNKQLGSLVVGVELDGAWSAISGTQPLSFGTPVAGYNARESSRFDGIATLAGRAGLAADRWLVFVKGGLAAVHAKHDYVFNDVFFPFTTSVEAAARETRSGAMLGFGAEYALSPHWSIKAEYDYLHLPGHDAQFVGTARGSTFPTSPISFTQPIEQSLHLVKVGANYRLDVFAPEPHFAAVPPVRGTNWSGAYVGIEGGFGRERESRPDFNNVLDGSRTLGADGGLFGVNGGVNAQAGSLVFGVEGEWMWSGFKANGNAAGTFNLGAGTANIALGTAIDWLAIAGAKAGFVVGDRLLVYGKGGVAIAQEKHTSSAFSTQAGTEDINLSSKAVHTGGVIGAGAEYAFAKDWSVKAEYNYILMAGQAHTATGQQSINGAAPYPTNQNFDKISQDIQLVKVGLNYRLPIP